MEQSGKRLVRTMSEQSKKWRGIVEQYIMPYKWEYLVGSIFVLIILFSTMYFDFFATFRHGVNFWYALFEGHPLSFYSYAKAIPGGTPNRTINATASYDFTIYLFFAIWNFPAWLYERISGSYAESCFLFLAWGKLMLPLIAILTAGGMKKILEFITGGCKDTAGMIYAWSFSGILMMAAYSIGQYDIIGVLFAVYGLYYFLRQDYKRFYLYFGVAVSCKYFAIFLFVCLVLLYEKRILYIIRNLLAGCYLVVIEKVLFSLGKSYASIHAEAGQAASAGVSSSEMVATGLLSTRIHYLFHLKIFMGVDSISLFIFLIILIWAYCYLQRREENYRFYYKVIYIAFCINAVFILYTASTPYWAVVMVPYMLLVIHCRTGNRKINMLLETAGIGCFLVWHLAREPYFFNSESCEGMLLYYLFGKPYFYSQGLSPALAKLIEEGGILTAPMNMVRSLFYACMLVFLIINFPTFNKGENDFANRQEEVGMRGLLAFRMVCMAGVLLLPLAGYAVQVFFGEYLSTLQTQNQNLNAILPYLIN